MRATGPGNEDDRRSALVVYDAATLTRLDSVRVGLAAHGLTTSPDGRTAFVTCYGSDELAVVALDGPTLSVTRVPVGPGAGTGATAQYGPYAALMSPDGGLVYVSNLESRDVRVFDVARGAFDPARVALVRARRSSPRSARTARPCWCRCRAPTASSRSMPGRSPSCKSRSFTRAECHRPHEAARAPDGRYFLVCEGDREGPGALVAAAARHPRDPRPHRAGRLPRRHRLPPRRSLVTRGRSFCGRGRSRQGGTVGRQSAASPCWAPAHLPARGAGRGTSRDRVAPGQALVPPSTSHLRGER